MFTMTRVLRKTYDWILSWANSPYAIWALGLVALVESSFFPIPPDVLLMALCVARPNKAWQYALVCSIGSVVGGALGYVIGLAAFESFGLPILNFYGAMDKYEWLSHLYQKHDAMVVFIAGFTPIPYKVFTLAAGVFQVNFPVFIGASVLSRSLRFVLIAGMFKKFGPKIKDKIDRYFGWFSYGFVILLVAGFAVVKFVL